MKIPVVGGGGGGGSGEIYGDGGDQACGPRVKNPNWNPRFKSNTTLGLKIKKLKMKAIMEKANFDQSTYVPCDKVRNKRCLTFHAKDLCQTRCRHTADHKKLPDAAVKEMYDYISDGCR